MLAAPKLVYLQLFATVSMLITTENIDDIVLIFKRWSKLLPEMDQQ